MLVVSHPNEVLEKGQEIECRVLSVDPVQLNIDEGAENIATHEFGHLVGHLPEELVALPLGELAGAHRFALVVLAPFLTGFAAHRQWMAYQPLLIVHIISGALFLLVIHQA